MPTDRYTKIVLTVIAAALMYLCAVLTPLPVASAQGGRIVGTQRPGEYTGPAEVAVVEWRIPPGTSIPVTVTRGEVQVTNEVAVRGDVEINQPASKPLRSVLVGFEEGSTPARAGRFSEIAPLAGRALPVTNVPARP